MRYAIRSVLAAALALPLAPLAASSPTTASAQDAVSAADVVALEGTWVLDLTASGSTVSERRVITTDPVSLRFEVLRAADDHPFTLVYKLDGSDSSNRFGKGMATSRLRREGRDLITETVFTVSDQPITVIEILRVNAGRTEMMADTTLRIEHGYTGTRSPLETTPPNVVKANNLFRKQP